MSIPPTRGAISSPQQRGGDSHWPGPGASFTLLHHSLDRDLRPGGGALQGALLSARVARGFSGEEGRRRDVPRAGVCFPSVNTKCLLPAAPWVGLGMGCEMMVVLPETLFVVALKIFILFYFRI